MNPRLHRVFHHGERFVFRSLLFDYNIGVGGDGGGGLFFGL